MMGTEAIRRKIMRGAVAMALYEAQDSPLLAQTIEWMLEPVNPAAADDMALCVNYLLDRGYVKICQECEPGGTRPMPHALLLRITDKGQDLCEGTLRDPGVIFPKADRR